MSEAERLFLRFCRDGDVEALTEVFDELSQKLLALARHLTRDEAEAEDLVQETFVVAIEDAKSFDASRELLPWLGGILSNRAALWRRRRLRCPDPEGLAERPPPEPDQAAEDRELRDAIALALERLPQPYREVVEARLQGRRSVDIAAALRRPADTVRMQLHRGLQKLRRLLPPGILAGSLFVTIEQRGLAAVRSAVAQRASLLPAAGAVLGGLFVLKKLLIAAAVLAAVGTAAWFSGRNMRTAAAPSPPVAATPVLDGPPVGREVLPDTASQSVRREEVEKAAAVASGRVRTLDCQPIEGACVFGLERGGRRAFATTSGAEGEFAAPEGFRGMVVAEAPGFGRGRDRLFSGAGALPAGMFDVRLQPAVSIVGAVRWLGGAPVEAAAVEVRDDLFGELGPFAATTAGDGTFRIDGFPAATFGPTDWRVLRPDGEVGAFGSLPGPLQEPTQRLDVELGAGAALEIEVRDGRDATPLEGALAVVCDARAPRAPESRAGDCLLLEHGLTDAAGRAVLRGLPRGSYWLLCAASGCGSVVVPLEVHQTEGSLNRAVSLLPGCVVSGRVLRGDGSAAPSWPIAVVDAADLDPTILFGGQADLHPFAAAGAAPWGANPFQRRKRTGDDGSFLFEGLPATPHLFVRTDPYARQSAQAGPFALQPGDRLENIELRLPRQVRIEGTVSTEDGAPLPAGSRVEVYLPPGSARVAEDGSFAIEVLEQAETLFCARAEGYLQATVVLTPPLPSSTSHLASTRSRCFILSLPRPSGLHSTSWLATRRAPLFAAFPAHASRSRHHMMSGRRTSAWRP
ncbi:MAG: sigma-70 family RNA polymerase sigma factor [Planctomycetes bacterium]|nr:sigma-70 family RNA polymerase sigma factor [Planctomycetota bacterium]